MEPINCHSKWMLFTVNPSEPYLQLTQMGPTHSQPKMDPIQLTQMADIHYIVRSYRVVKQMDPSG